MLASSFGIIPIPSCAFLELTVTAQCAARLGPHALPRGCSTGAVPTYLSRTDERDVTLSRVRSIRYTFYGFFSMLVYRMYSMTLC